MLNSLRSKLITTILGVALLSTTVLSVYSVATLKSTTKENLEKTFAPTVEQSAGVIDLTVKAQMSEIENLAKSESFISAEGEEKLKAMESGISDSYREDFAIFSSDGKIVASKGTLSGDDTVTEAVAKVLESKNAQVTDVETSDIFAGYTIAVPVVSGDSIVAVATATYDVEALCEYISGSTFGETGSFMLVDNDGCVVATSSKSRSDEHNPIELAKKNEDYESEAEFVKNVIKNESGFGEYEAEGEKKIGSYQKAENVNVSVVICCDKDEYLGSGAIGSVKLSITILGVLIVAVIISLFIARTISRPIVNTTQRLRGLSQGNLSDPVDVCYSKDEIGVLSNSLEETVVSLRQYINLITVALQNISEGNLSHRVDGNFKGDFIKIKSTFNEILESLSDTFASINVAAEQVSTGAVQVSNNAQNLSQGSTQQASSIEELSATITDVSNQTAQNARSAKEAYMIVQSNTDAIAACNEDMENMLSAMGEISESSAEISKIIKVIDDISFQTNILALNAAVEAAREGSKGFGVVADEVRRLASKSAEAAKQTAELIENSLTAISRGSDIAQQTAGALNKIVDDSTEIKKLVKEISDASDHQAEAIVQINTGVDQISAVVANNTSTAVGSASASEELSSQSLILKNMIARFKLSKDSKSTKGMYDYVSDSEPTATATSKFSYTAEDFPEDEAAPSMKFAYPDEPEESSISKFAYPDDDDEEEVKIILDDDEEFNPESINDEDDKY